MLRRVKNFVLWQLNLDATCVMFPRLGGLVPGTSSADPVPIPGRDGVLARAAEVEGSIAV